MRCTDLDKTLVEAEIMPDGVLPALLVLAIVREVSHYVLVNAVEREPLFRAVADRHHYEGVVAIGWFIIWFLFFFWNKKNIIRNI